MSQSTPALRAVPPFVQGALWDAGHVVIPLAPFVPFDWTGCELRERDGVALIPQQLVGGATTTHSGHRSLAIDQPEQALRSPGGPAWC